ncbi:MAG: 3-oxoacyl-ACP synthase III [Planctomycetaceae bacterium]
MRYRQVCIEAFAYSLPPCIVSSAEIEERLAPVYRRFELSVGRLELMTGIRERRFWDRGILPGSISAQTAERALQACRFDREQIGFLAHGSVCRDRLEPATASSVHQALKLSPSALVFDVSNACLGLLNGMLMLANMIELEQVSAGIVVGTEMGRDLVEGTIDSLLKDPRLTRQDLKLAFASLTIGSGSAALVLCHRRLSRTGNSLLGGAFAADTTSHELCAGGVKAHEYGDDRPRMQTDSEALLHAGVALAERTWGEARHVLNWTNDSVSRAFTHQVGRAHRKLLYERLGLDPAIDFSTVEFLGNTGAAALPLTAALGIEQGHVKAGDRVALLGIGSGLNALMLGIDWQGG